MYVMFDFSARFTLVQQHSQSTESCNVSVHGVRCLWAGWKMMTRCYTGRSVTRRTRMTQQMNLAHISRIMSEFSNFAEQNCCSCLLLLLLQLQQFYGPLDCVRDYPGELVPER